MTESNFQINNQIAQIITNVDNIFIESFAWAESDTIYDNCILCNYGAMLL